MKSANVIVIGVGPHARRIYIPAFIKLSKSMPVQLVAAVDLVSQKELVNSYLKDNGYALEMLYFEPFDAKDGLPQHCINALNTLVDTLNVQGVIIATEPMVHKMYAQWALERGLHILMDKPISVRKSVSTDITQAAALIDDYEELLALYEKSQEHKPTAFSVNVQRRYEYGFDKVKALISEVRDKFNMPVTSIQAMHADGTWMFPQEIITQESHRYFDGYGKASHSGYHIFDMAWQLYRAGMITAKRPDHMEVFSSPLFPDGLNIDLTEDDYRSYFGSAYESTDLTFDEYEKKVKLYGEVDSFSIVRLLKDDKNICNISINLLHSSFSRRAWPVPRADRYKGNGRVKHQQFIIQQGPFQCIQIHNYQSKDSHDIDNSNEFDIGGNNHFDIYVFRNVGMFGSGEPFYKISAKELEEEALAGKLVIEKAKERVIVEFINFMVGNITKADLKSNIDSHRESVQIMSGIYQSMVHLHQQQNSVVRIAL